MRFYAASLILGWTIAPSLVSTVAFTSSSSHGTAKALVFLSNMVSMKARRLSKAGDVDPSRVAPYSRS